ncbi:MULTISPECIES: hypothetical protein [Robiginitalea]|uniref:hypothetical protein n=1 Tax=Robiginitalea TaxID=252306 RepID=UPI0023490074|nr:MULTISPECIES: hypothetical protein [unclassified Robiginitalea]MDC6355730.1 hypothetical protein [Robiginitalea sp. PM2]MDC6376139.1 hypothetical protein [Robiginitalea sp. SP8]
MTPKKILLFVVGLYYSGKIIELTSFIIWELKYSLKLYSKNQILEFSDNHPSYILEDDFLPSEIQAKNFNLSRNEINWSLVFIDGLNNYWGVKYEEQSTLFYYTAENKLISSFRFNGQILGIYVSKANNVFCCANGVLYKLCEIKNRFIPVQEFSTPHSYFRIDAFTESPSGELFIGEYANVYKKNKWKFVGHIYHSRDNGNSWKTIDFLKNVGVNKHVHIIKWSNILKGLILTDGDNQKNTWINISEYQFDKPSSYAYLGWKKLNKYHIQKGGHTGIAELHDQIFFGSDYMGGTNFFIKTNDMKRFTPTVIPNPYRRSIFNRIAIRKSQHQKYEIWSGLKFEHSGNLRSLIMVSTDLGETWERIIEYDGTQFDVLIISNSVEIASELHLVIKDKKKKVSTTICVN